MCVIGPVECDATTLTVAVWVIAMALIVAETVSGPSVSELTDPLAIPFASVGAAGCVTFAAPLPASVTAASLIGLP